MRKLTIEEMRQLASQRDGKCLSTVYEASYVDLEWECKNGHRWFAPPKSVKQGYWCNQCVVNSRKKSIEDMHVLAKKKGGKCLSTQYVNSGTHLLWECRKGHQWCAIPHAINGGTWCPFCAHVRPHTLEDLRELAKTRDGQCLATEYVNSKTKVLWQCNQGHQWWAVFGSIKHQKTWCPICAKARKA